MAPADRTGLVIPCSACVEKGQIEHMAPADRTGLVIPVPVAHSHNHPTG